MTAAITHDLATVHLGDCLAVLRDLPDNSVDAVVTDPPYGLSNTDPAHVVEALTRWATGDREFVPAGRGFMGKSWDSFVPPPAVWDECLRVLKPGGHLLAFAGSRTYDLMTLSIRLAGFDIRDGIAWLYGSGFPKSLDVSKAIDKAAGAERHDVYADKAGVTTNEVFGKGLGVALVERRPATAEAEKWNGWGTALKPAFEPIVVARKPLIGTVAANVLAYGTGGLNIDGTRVPTTDRWAASGVQSAPGVSLAGSADGSLNVSVSSTHDGGRWPANVVIDGDTADALDVETGTLTSGSRTAGDHVLMGYQGASAAPMPAVTGDSGGASRFFPTFRYQAKASTRERPTVTSEDGTKTAHPTVKPLALMQWLIRLVTPPGGTVLDPFTGSGTTVEAAALEGFTSIGVERDPDYLPLIQVRLDRLPGVEAAA